MKSLSCVQLFQTPWTVACQASPSMGFSKQDTGVKKKKLKKNKKNTGVGCHWKWVAIFLTQGSNPGLQHEGRPVTFRATRGSLKKKKKRKL